MQSCSTLECITIPIRTVVHHSFAEKCFPYSILLLPLQNDISVFCLVSFLFPYSQSFARIFQKQLINYKVEAHVLFTY